MEFEFDKEIDSLLRQTAKGGNVFAAENSSGEHIDADGISMFAENALPEKAKLHITKHLAGCDKCRIILSNTIFLNAEAEREDTASIVVQENKAETVAASNEILWYKNLFSTKNLAYGMGALALIFAVGIGFLVLQNANESMNSEVAQANTNISSASAEKSSSDEMPEATEAVTANSNATSMDANSSNVESNAEKAATSPNLSSDNKQAANNITEKEASGNLAKNSERKDAKRDAPKAKTAPIDSAADADVGSADKEQNAESTTRPQNEMMARKSSAPPPPSVTAGRNEPMAAESAKKRESEDDRSDNLMMSAPSRKINGKTFNRKNGVWYDSAYKGQATTNIRRGTDQYKNLDSGLRSIGNQLDGTVVVVWKAKAYRIQ